MDKFGIFNLLNSFLNFSGDKNPIDSSSSQSSSTDLTSPKPDFLGSLLSSLNPENKPTPIANTKPETPKPPVRASSPLQRQMLSTIKSHDELINRVMKNKPKA